MNIALLGKTDQVQCFDAKGREIACRGTGQDGEFNPGRPVDPDRFGVSGDIVEDRWTGLLWPRIANLPEFPLTWEEAFAFIREMNRSKTGGIDHWRLPAREELFSLISHQFINPALPENHPFEEVFNGYYWTRTECARLPDQAWYVHLGGGRVYRGMKHGSYLVWPVSGAGSTAPSGKDRFFAREGCLLDRATERTWFFGKDPGAVPVSWEEAFSQIQRLNREKAAGYADWRLPGIRELNSLVDPGRHSPAMVPWTGMPDIREGYWSATTSTYEPRYAWVLYPRDGAVGVGFKAGADFYVAAVR